MSLALRPLAGRVGRFTNLVAWKRRNPTASSALTNLIVANVFDPARGIYLPTFKDPKLFRHLPTFSEEIALAGGSVQPLLNVLPYFGNGLAIPAHYEAPLFDAGQALPPMRRSTNIGFTVVTMEVDPPSACPECLDEQLAWTRGWRGDFRKSALAQVDAELRRPAVKGYPKMGPGP